jgi:hypothetical protein
MRRFRSVREVQRRSTCIPWHSDFLAQLKEAVQKGIFGYSADDVAQWAFRIGNLLNTCVEYSNQGSWHSRNPHCWLDFPTVIRHAYRKGPGYEIPAFTEPQKVGYCPWGTYSACYLIE